MKTKPLTAWTAAITLSLIFLVAMGVLQYRVLMRPGMTKQEEIAIVSKEERSDFLAKLESSREHQKAIRVPTGVFVQSVEFSSSYDIEVTGYVWQILPTNVSMDSFGVIFPEAESMEIEQAYQSGNVTGWYFQTTLRQPFDYSNYPFDRESVWIRLWPRDFHRNIILVPDLESYDSLLPSALPGLEEAFFIEGWEVLETYFSYRTNRYNSDFGLAIQSDKALPWSSILILE